MNHTDFSKTGGFPLDTDVLDFNHKALAAGFQWPAEIDSNGNLLPLILAGCIDFAGNDFYTPGWLLINGEPLPFAGGFANYSNSTEVYLVETRQPAVFEDGQSHDVYEVTRHVDVDGSLPDAVAIGEIATFKRWEALLGERAKEVFATRTLTLLGAAYSATCKYRVNLLTRLVTLTGTVQVTNAQALSSPSIMYQAAPVALPAPAVQHVFQAGIKSQNSIPASDEALRDFYFEVRGSDQVNPGLFSMGLRKPSDPAITSYTLNFSTIYSLD